MKTPHIDSASIYSLAELRKEVKRIKHEIRKDRNKPEPGWYIRITGTGAALCVEYWNTKIEQYELWNVIL